MRHPKQKPIKNTFWNMKPNKATPFLNIKPSKIKVSPVTPVNLKPYTVRSKKETRLIDTKPFIDSDKDGVVNYFDCKPLNKKKQDYMKNKRMLERRAKKIFGTTTNTRATGYILASGEKLNFNRDSSLGLPERDHSEINQVFHANYSKNNIDKIIKKDKGYGKPIKRKNEGYWRYNEVTPYVDLNSRDIFIDKANAIRYSPEVAGSTVIELSYKGITQKQKDTIAQIIREKRKEDATFAPGSIIYDIIGPVPSKYNKPKYNHTQEQYPLVASGIARSIPELEAAIKEVQEKYKKEKEAKPEVISELPGTRKKYYHGTSSEKVPGILKEGILPSGKLSKDLVVSEYSNPEYTYFAEVPYIADSWAHRLFTRKGQPVVLEVEIPEEKIESDSGYELRWKVKGEIPPHKIKIYKTNRGKVNYPDEAIEFEKIRKSRQQDRQIRTIKKFAEEGKGSILNPEKMYTNFNEPAEEYEKNKKKFAEKIYYHGGKEEIKTTFRGGRRIGEVYLTPNLKYAKIFADNSLLYGDKKGGVVTKVNFDAKKPYKLKGGEIVGVEDNQIIEQPQEFKGYIEDLKNKGYDSIISQDKRQILVFNPSTIVPRGKVTDDELKGVPGIDLSELEPSKDIVEDMIEEPKYDLDIPKEAKEQAKAEDIELHAAGESSEDWIKDYADKQARGAKSDWVDVVDEVYTSDDEAP